VDIDEVTDLFGQPRLGVVVAKVFPLVESIRCNLAEAPDPRLDIAGAGKEERIEQVRAFEVFVYM
jgi:hypothetical protein